MAHDSATPYSAQQVADTFVNQFYEFLRKNPQNVHRFYKDDSIVTRPLPEGLTSSVTTMQAINDDILSSEYKDWETKINNVQGQYSIMGSVIVAVTGSFTDSACRISNFARTFFLAPQDVDGFYVRNDILLFEQINEDSTDSPVAEAGNDSPVAPLLQDTAENTLEAPADVAKSEQLETCDTIPEVVENVEKVEEILNNVEEKDVHLPVKNEVITHIPHKVSYASIAAKASSLPQHAVRNLPKTTPPASRNSHAPTKASAPRSTAGLGNTSVNKEGLLRTAPNAIYIKNLPCGITYGELLEEVKKLGAIKPKSIQIKNYPKDGYCFGFVEFQSADSARNAVEVGTISFNGRKSEIQYKKPSGQGGSNQGRSKLDKVSGFHSNAGGSRDGENGAKVLGNLDQKKM